MSPVYPRNAPESGDKAGALPAPTAHARFALWLEHHARTASSPQRAAEEAAATCRGLYPHQARQTGKETNR